MPLHNRYKLVIHGSELLPGFIDLTGCGPQQWRADIAYGNTTSSHHLLEEGEIAAVAEKVTHNIDLLLVHARPDQISGSSSIVQGYQ